ncbi:glycosyltransferase family A protein [Flavobacterium agrisoli]|uniref:Glycosyltransferase family 2 protein n=1 Tax=Flavobacterium agrisoli TaxID=2793066 RepID=A0A934PRG4_9FLAO|nr:glycosyltransferase family A protein [Flavobacterium agrisoli]MBK0371241.1 glycosyltransferase family 2 protein [Flavobacterium agrisoli]
MRIGMNPQKQEKKVVLNVCHRIVVVVYIPNEEGFYKDSFKVFKTCLDSLVSTTNSNAAITVVNNGSYERVGELLALYYKDKKIDTLISHNINIGKIDAQIGAARGAREKYITLTDADILFVKGWQEKIEEIFFAFNNVGSVSPIPIRTGLYAGTSSVLKQILFRKVKFKFVSIPENLVDYNRFLSSINWDLETDENKKWPIVERNSVKAVIGSAHQVLTINRDVLFKTSPSNPSLTLVGGNSEHNYVDVPIDKSGKLRLATFNNYAFHIGNKLEDWMIELQKKNIESNTVFESNSNLPKSYDLFNSKMSYKLYNIKKRYLKKIFSLIYGKE